MKKIIYTLFVFVFLFGLFSCGEEKSSSSSSSDSSSNGESLGGEPMKQPNCDEIDGVTVKPDKYTGIYKHCANGKVLWYETYKNGKQVGIERGWWKSTGHLKYENMYDENGKSTGLTRAWYKDGQLSGEVNYKNGEQVKGRNYHRNGQLKVEFDSEKGTHKQWDENGNQTYP
jgi:antitoxin component YwqK of YwqJK toxin-antitoxin module